MSIFLEVEYHGPKTMPPFHDTPRNEASLIDSASIPAEKHLDRTSESGSPTPLPVAGSGPPSFPSDYLTTTAARSGTAPLWLLRIDVGRGSGEDFLVSFSTVSPITWVWGTLQPQASDSQSPLAADSRDAVEVERKLMTAADRVPLVNNVGVLLERRVNKDEVYGQMCTSTFSLRQEDLSYLKLNNFYFGLAQAATPRIVQSFAAGCLGLGRVPRWKTPYPFLQELFAQHVIQTRSFFFDLSSDDRAFHPSRFLVGDAIHVSKEYSFIHWAPLVEDKPWTLRISCIYRSAPEAKIINHVDEEVTFDSSLDFCYLSDGLYNALVSGMIQSHPDGSGADVVKQADAKKTVLSFQFDGQGDQSALSIEYSQFLYETLVGGSDAEYGHLIFQRRPEGFPHDTSYFGMYFLSRFAMFFEGEDCMIGMADRK